MKMDVDGLMFLSTPPSRVATLISRFNLSKLYKFLSTPPSRVATKQYEIDWRAEYVSIHATLAGGDM